MKHYYLINLRVKNQSWTNSKPNDKKLHFTVVGFTEIWRFFLFSLLQCIHVEKGENKSCLNPAEQNGLIQISDCSDPAAGVGASRRHK